MRAVIPRHTFLPQTLPRQTGSNLIEQSLAPLRELAKASESMVADSIGTVATQAGKLHIPRFVFLGPKGGGDTIRLALFTAFQGNEIEGAEIVAELFQALEKHAELAQGYHIFAYPICNPWGFATANRLNEAGEDLTRHFWRGSDQVEIYYLEREMGVRQFHGVISLHISDGEEFGYALGQSPSAVLREALVRPALAAVGAAHSRSVSGGFLTSTEELRTVPFEINWWIPRARVNAGAPLLLSILDSYRTCMGWRPNI